MPTVTPFDLGSHCMAAAYLGDVAVFAMADGTVHRVGENHATSRPHDGILCAATDTTGMSLATGGEDGKVVRIMATGEPRPLAEQPGRWINCIACGPQDTVAWASGRTATVHQRDGSLFEFTEDRTIEGLAFSPKGLRVAAARYGGLSLHWVATSAPSVNLDWKGAHTDVTFSPDGKYVVSTMVENALHGWRLKDGRHMRMTGYPSKVRSLSWSARAKWLASSGAPAAIFWPFTGKDGPMGKAPIELGERTESLVTSVACHPADEVAAIGYADGTIIALRIADGRQALLRPAGSGAVSSLGWHRRGSQLAFGSASGDCGIIGL